MCCFDIIQKLGPCRIHKRTVIALGVVSSVILTGNEYACNIDANCLKAILPRIKKLLCDSQALKMHRKCRAVHWPCS